ncbi:hypothetical protein LZ31DRAFT_622056, partial [Colletotrichum somersetense]
LDVLLPDERVSRKRRLETVDARPCSRRKKDSKEQRFPAIIAKMENIASPSTIVRLWSSFRASRNGIVSLGGYRQVLPVEPETHLDGPSVLERLDILKEQSAQAGSNVHFSTAIGRFHHVQMVHLYQRAKSLDQSTENVTECGPNGAVLSLVDQFAQKLFPNKAAATLQSIPKAAKRNPLKSAFNRWLTFGKRLVVLWMRSQFTSHYDRSYADDSSFRRLQENELIAVLDRLDTQMELNESIEALTHLLPNPAAGAALPEKKLRLEMYSFESHVFALASASAALRDLLSWCDDPLSFHFDSPIAPGS